MRGPARLLLLLLAACREPDDTDPSDTETDADTDADADTDTDADTDADTDTIPTTCDGIWDELDRMYPDAGTVGACTGDAAVVADSFMKLDGHVTIDNDGETLTPCVQVQCDSTWAYVATNALPHYDFVATTPNPLVENRMLYRFRLAPQAIATTASPADDAATATDTCVEAYGQLVQGRSYTTREPGGLCAQAPTDAPYLTEELATGTATYEKLQCLDAVAATVNGVPVFGPNEGPTPDPWGNPLVSIGNDASEWSGEAMLDLCLGHTANAMHYHGLNEECLAVDESGAAANSYAEAAEAFDLKQLLEGACTAPSGIVGWNLDGYPIYGPCVCTERSGDGSCTEVKRARSSWVYQGMSAWGSHADEDRYLATEGDACADDGDCGGDLACQWSVVDDDGAAGSSVEKICVQADYSWCSNAYVDRTATDTSAEEFVYLDRCNGFEGADGYGYHATASFPFVPACYSAEASESVGRGVYVDERGGP
jgi:hypothetical protein